MKGIRWLALIGGVLFLAGTGSIAHKALSSWRVIPGSVLRAELVYSKDGADPADIPSQARIEYRYLYEGQVYTGLYQSVLSSGEFFNRRLVQRHRPGEPVLVRVDPAKPASSRLKTNFFRENEMGLLLTASGVLFLVMFFGIRNQWGVKKGQGKGGLFK